MKKLFAPKWQTWRVFHSEEEAREVQAVLEQEHIRYKLSAYTRESRTLASAHQFTNNRYAQMATRTAYMSDVGLETYTFEVHRDDLEKVNNLDLSGTARTETAYNTPLKPWNKV